MITLQRYTPAENARWNDFVANAKNGTFLFDRNYMEYHADRFCDHSLLLFQDNKLVALLPANEVDNTLYTHQGLTYGGMILSPKATTPLVLALFEALWGYLRERGFTSVVYKCVPHIYHRYGAEEEGYALFLKGATLVARNLSSALSLSNPLPFATLRRRGVTKATKAALTVEKSDNFAPFWELLQENLTTRFGVLPVHSLEEITLLASRFPQQIALYNVTTPTGEVVAGAVTYTTPTVCHVQYISASAEGKQLGALDLLFDYLIHRAPHGAEKYFDFGQSTEESGRYLNEGLVAQKEGFGARAILYDTYQVTL